MDEALVSKVFQKFGPGGSNPGLDNGHVCLGMQNARTQQPFLRHLVFEL
jgi:hypothetical protein